MMESRDLPSDLFSSFFLMRCGLAVYAGMTDDGITGSSQ